MNGIGDVWVERTGEGDDTNKAPATTDLTG